MATARFLATPYLNVRLMSPEQREEEAKQILERIAALGLPIPDEYVTVEVSDAEYEELVRGGRAQCDAARIPRGTK